LYRVLKDSTNQQSSQLGSGIWHKGFEAGSVYTERMLQKVSGLTYSKLRFGEKAVK